MIESIEWVGCITGLSGSILLATNSRYSQWGWIILIVSNIIWIIYGVLTHANGLIIQQIGFIITSMIGIWRWMIIPRKEIESTGRK